MDVTVRTIRDKNPALSPLMEKRAAVRSSGMVVNACPFNCEGDDLDEKGLCRHLIGYTNNTEEECRAGKGQYEPLVYEGDSRMVRVERERKPAMGPGGKKVTVEGKPILPPVLKSDKLVRITTSCRVYRDVDAEQTKKP